MALQWKRNTRYPSVTRPGIFPRIQELDDQGVDLLAETWEDLTGIDEDEINKFKFALGSWVQFTRLNRLIYVLSGDLAGNINFAITAEPGGEPAEPKPTYLPALPDGYSGIDFRTNLLEWAGGDDGGKQRVNFEMQKRSYTTNFDLREDGGSFLFDGLSTDVFNTDKTKFEKEKGYVQLEERKSRVRSRPSWYKTSKVGDVSEYLTGQGTSEQSDEDFAEQIPFKTAEELAGYWKITKIYAKKLDIFSMRYIVRLEVNVTDPFVSSQLMKGTTSEFSSWTWQPRPDLYTDPDTGLQAFGEWMASDNLVKIENQRVSDNKYVGLVTKNPIENVEEIQQGDLFLYHELNSEDYKDISSPLEVFFSMNYHTIDEVTSLAGKVKYYIIEWGDEDEKMSDENLLNSEFLYIYETEDQTFSYVKYKKLMLLIEDMDEIQGGEIAEVYNDEEDVETPATRGKLHSHVYTEPGVKTIKTMVLRFDTTGAKLLETSLVYTNIFIADPNQTIQNFNIFGGEDYTVLPLEEELEPIIGNIDKRSEYVRSIEKIKNNDLYQSSDYLEKLYADEFLPKVNQDLYGEYAGNVDLGLTRVFKKPYDIFDFIGADKLQIINNNFEYPQDSLPLNSSATEILIDNGDCVVNLNPSNQNNDQVENTGVSDEKGLLMGDFRLVKNPKQKIRKEDAMQIPKLNTQKKRQAF